MAVGDKVKLTTDNPHFDGRVGTVLRATEYGAVVSVGTRQFRALHSEMLQVPIPAVPPCFTGDMCWECGGFRMVRSGTCSTCIDCGATSGCS